MIKSSRFGSFLLARNALLRYAVCIKRKVLEAMDVFRPGGLELTKKAIYALGLEPGAKVLDIGCGLGATLSYLSEQFSADVYGLDSAPAAVKKAGECLGKERVLCADAACLPFADDSFQLVLMECVLTVIQEPEKALQEACRVLAPGGGIVISGLTGPECDRLCHQGRMDVSTLRRVLNTLNMYDINVSDETAILRRFVAEIIFEFDSIENYLAHADAKLGGSVLCCNMPMKGTGYALVTAKKAKV